MLLEVQTVPSTSTVKQLLLLDGSLVRAKQTHALAGFGPIASLTTSTINTTVTISTGIHVAVATAPVTLSVASAQAWLPFLIHR